MNVLLALLTVIMVLDCIFLVFLILLQLPKKEAGAGMAFGGGATDALFGAGSGNVLTKITKYVAGIFFLLALVMAIITANLNRGDNSLLNALTERPRSSSPAIAPSSVPGSNSTIPTTLLTNMPQRDSSAPATRPASTNSTGAPNLLTIPSSTATNR